MKKKVFIVIFIVAILLMANFSMAHKGRTDEFGGHYDHSTGNYHYHSGKNKDTGDYTAPIEKGGVKIDEEEDSGGLKINEEDTEELQEENDKLKEELNEINSKIDNMNANSIEDVEEIIQKQQEEIERLKDDKTSMWVMFVFFILLIAHVSYEIGNNRK